MTELLVYNFDLFVIVLYFLCYGLCAHKAVAAQRKREMKNISKCKKGGAGGAGPGGVRVQYRVRRACVNDCVSKM